MQPLLVIHLVPQIFRGRIHQEVALQAASAVSGALVQLDAPCNISDVSVRQLRWKQVGIGQGLVNVINVPMFHIFQALGLVISNRYG